MKLVENAQWVIEQFQGCDLGDKRRTKRLLKVADNMLARPEGSLQQQNNGWTDLKGAYRFFSNDAVTFTGVCEQHWKLTRQTSTGRYLLISDTTDINLTKHKATKGLGILGNGDGRGIQLHSCLLYDTNKNLFLGSPGATLYKRKRVKPGETRKQRLKRFRESALWGKLVDEIGKPPVGSQWIHVFDRGGDNFEAMCRIKLQNCDWIIRAARLQRKVLDQENQTVKLESLLGQGEVLGTYELHLRARQGVEARIAKIEVSTFRVTYPAPKVASQWLKDCGITSLSMNVVVVKEVDAPKGVKPVLWVLLTSLPVNTWEEVWQIITDYETRWIIEEYHKVIKSGCNIQGHSLRHADRHEPLIGLISVVGTRLFQLKFVGRNQPEAKAATHVPASWIRCLLLMRPNLKATGLTVYQFMRELAILGGFIGRKSDGEPGWETIWRGYQRMRQTLEGMQLAEPN